MKTRIVKATSADAWGLRDLRLELVKEDPQTFGVSYKIERKKGINEFKRLIEEYSQKNSALFLVKDGNKIIGMIKIRPESKKKKDEGYFGSLGILPEYRRKKLATILTEHAIGWAGNNTNFKVINAIAVKTNKASIDFSKKLGFKIVGEGKYRGVPEVYMQLKL